MFWYQIFFWFCPEIYYQISHSSSFQWVYFSFFRKVFFYFLVPDLLYVLMSRGHCYIVHKGGTGHSIICPEIYYQTSHSSSFQCLNYCKDCIKYAFQHIENTSQASWDCICSIIGNK